MTKLWALQSLPAEFDRHSRADLLVPEKGSLIAVVRDASAKDAEACREIYLPYVMQTAVTIEIGAPTVAEVADRITAAVQAHAWLVLERKERIIGFAKARVFRGRPAYRWSCETSIYLESACQGLAELEPFLGRFLPDWLTVDTTLP